MFFNVVVKFGGQGTKVLSFCRDIIFNEQLKKKTDSYSLWIKSDLLSKKDK
jgi:hypothetical protein